MPYFGFTGSTFINMPWFSPSWFAVLLTRSTSWSSEMFFTSSHELGSIFDQQPVDSYPISEEARMYMVTPFTQPCPYPHGVLLQLIWRVGEPPAPWTFCFVLQLCQSTFGNARLEQNHKHGVWGEGWEKSRIFPSTLVVESDGVLKA